ncbi:hypothetical protein ABTN09_20385, partial [Acinetobacter baumannii]
ELQEDIKLSETSQIIGLADSDPSEGTEALIAGWGRLEVSSTRVDRKSTFLEFQNSYIGKSFFIGRVSTLNFSRFF